MTPEQEAILRKLTTGDTRRLPMGPLPPEPKQKKKAMPPSVTPQEGVFHQRRIRHSLILRVCKISTFTYADIAGDDKATLLLTAPFPVSHLMELYAEFDQVVTENMVYLLRYGTAADMREQRRKLTRLLQRYSIR